MLKLHQLEVLVAMAEMGGVRAAARTLHVSQSAVTKALKSLEDAAGVPLMARQSTGMNLTEAGKALLVRAQAITRQVKLAEEELKLAQGHLGGSVRVSITPLVALTCLGEAYDWFRQRFPDVEVHISEGLLHRVMPRLRDGTADFAIVAATQRLVDDHNVTQEILASVKQNIVLRKRHGLARYASASALSNEDWILTHPLSERDGSAIAAMFVAAGVPIPERVIVCDAIAALALQRTTNLIGLMPEPMLKHPWAHGVIQAPDTELIPPNCNLMLLHRADVPLTPAAQFLAHCLKATISGHYNDIAQSPLPKLMDDGKKATS